MITSKILDSVKHNLEIVNNFKSGLTIHLLGSRKTKLVVAKDIFCTLASSQYVSSNKGVAKMLGVDKRNIKKTMGW